MYKRERWLTDPDSIIVFLLMVNLFFLNFLGEGQLIIEWTVRVLVILRFVQRYVLKIEVRIPFMLVAGVFLYLFIITIANGTLLHMHYNMLMIGSSIILYMYLGCISCYRKDIVHKYLEKSLVFFHVFYWINNVFIIQQTNADIFYDNRTGFFGQYGTHRLMCFVCFLVLADLKIAFENPRKKTRALINAVTVVASAIIIASFNDNTALYVMLPVVIVMFIILKSKINPIMLFRILGVCGIVYLAFLMLLKNPEIADFLEKRLFDKLLGFSSFFETGEIGEERYVYIKYALDNLNGWGTGLGLGKVRFLGDENITSLGIDYRNWGMTNMASFIAVGGIVFTFFYIFLNERFLLLGKKPAKTRVLLFLLLIIFCYYSQPFIGIVMPVCIWHMTLPLIVEENTSEEEWYS